MFRYVGWESVCLLECSASRLQTRREGESCAGVTLISPSKSWNDRHQFDKPDRSPNVAQRLAELSAYMWDEMSRWIYLAWASVKTAAQQRLDGHYRARYFKFYVLRQQCGPPQLRLVAVEARHCPAVLDSSHMQSEMWPRHLTLIANQSGLAYHLLAAPGFCCLLFTPEQDYPAFLLDKSVFLCLSGKGFFTNYGRCFLSLWIKGR